MAESKHKHSCKDPECKHNHQEDRTEDNSRADQEKMMKLSILEQQAKQIEQQLQMLDQQIIELQLLKMNLDDLKKVEMNAEFLAPMGRGIFIQSVLKSRELYVNAGAKTMVKKSIDETKSIVEKDISSLSATRDRILEELNQVAQEISKA